MKGREIHEVLVSSSSLIPEWYPVPLSCQFTFRESSPTMSMDSSVAGWFIQSSAPTLTSWNLRMDFGIETSDGHPLKSKNSRFVSSPIDEGNSFSILQFPRSKQRRRVRFTNVGGRLTIDSQDRISSSTRLWKFPTQSGIFWRFRHLCKDSSSKATQPPIDEGKYFKSTHFANTTSTRLQQSPMLSGRAVIDLHSLIYRKLNFANPPKESGSLSNPLHLSNTSSSKFFSRPIDCGSCFSALLAIPEEPPKFSFLKL